MPPSTRDATAQKPKSARSRPRSSMACLSCRQKKIKCNVQTLGPNVPCSACETSNCRCVVIPNDDRRKHGSRDHISALQVRMASIEALVGRYGANLDDLAQTKSPSSAPMDMALTDGILAATVSSQPDSHTIPTLVSNVQLDPAQNQSPQSQANSVTFQKPSEPASASPMDRPPSDTNSVSYQDRRRNSEFGPDMLTPTLHRALKERRASDINETRPTLDTDSSPGMVRYYGPTTQLYLQSSSDTDADRRSSTATTVIDFVIDMDSPQLRESLIQLSWSYYSRSVSIIDEHLFMSHRKTKERSQYYSNFLECALLACVTRIRTSQAMRPLGRSYADRAKQDLVYELENPTIATVQGLLLLSEFEATSARDRIGWTYSGIACRLLFDLGLHEDCSKLVKEGILSEADAQLRKELFLSSFVHDCLWALYLGRPCCVPLQSVNKAVKANIPATLRHWVELCTYIAELTDMLNGFGPLLMDDHAVDRLQSLSARIDNSYKSLPGPLSPLNVAGLHETAYGLNMQYCGIQIVLHRAIIKALCSNEAIDPHDARIGTSRRITEENAMSICQLVLAYREIFGVENFITVMLDNMYIAVGTLITHALHPPENESAAIPDLIRYLRIICETFDALQKHYVVAEKMRQTLATVTENTILASIFALGGSADCGIGTTPHVPEPPQDPMLPQVNASWGSMESLLNDNFLLGHGLFGDSLNPDQHLGDAMLM